VVTRWVPPLRERPEDIPPLVSTFVATYSARYGVHPVNFTKAALEAIDSYSWPGNVRELENCVRMLTCMQLNRAVEAEDLPFGLPDERQIPFPSGLFKQSFQDAKHSLMVAFETEYLERALRQSKGNLAEAARRSGKVEPFFFCPETVRPMPMIWGTPVER